MKSVIGVIGALLCSAIVAEAMPPSPELVERLKAEGRLDEVLYQISEAQREGWDRPGENILPKLRQMPGRDEGDEIEVRMPVVLVEFTDNRANQNQHPQEFYERQFYSLGEVETGSAREWYLENSYSEIDFQGQVSPWVTAAQSYAYYVNGNFGRGNYPRNSLGMAEAALRAADNQINYASFDNDRDGVVETVAIVHAGQGAESTGDANMIWAHANWFPNLRLDGVRISGYFTVSERGDIGGIVHESGHSYFGLPDLYDTDQSSHGVGYWSTMASGCWGNGGNTPVHWDAWCKIEVGVVQPRIISNNVYEMMMPSVVAEGAVAMVWTNGNPGSQYFLIENRQQVGFDSSLPGSGLLIYHIDQNVIRDYFPNDDEWYPGHENQGHYGVAVEQADGRFDLERNGAVGDRGDPWPGSTQNRRFFSGSTPNSRDYANRDTGVEIYEITSQNNRIVCNIDVGVEVEESDISVETWDVDFGSVPLNEGGTYSFGITNIGQEILIVEEFDIIGEDADQFSVESEPFDLNPGGEARFDIVFSPSSPGVKKAQMVVTSSDPDEERLVVELTGLGDAHPRIYEPVSENQYQLTVNAGETIDITFAARSPGDLPLTWIMNHAGGLPEAARFTDNRNGTAQLLWNIPAGGEGRYAPRFVVRDEDTLQDEIRLFLTVTNGNSVEDDAGLIPVPFQLHSVAPNPFNSQLSIRYSAGEEGTTANLRVFNLKGEEVANFSSMTRGVNAGAIVWNAGNIPAGIYIVRLESGGKFESRKVVLVR